VFTLRSISKISGSGVSVKSYVAPKAHCNKKAASVLDTPSVIADTCTGASRVGAPAALVDALTRGNSISAMAVRVTKRRTTWAILNGRRRKRHKQSRLLSVAEIAPPQTTLQVGQTPYLADTSALKLEPRRSRRGCRQDHHSIPNPNPAP